MKLLYHFANTVAAISPPINTNSYKLITYIKNNFMKESIMYMNIHVYHHICDNLRKLMRAKSAGAYEPPEAARNVQLCGTALLLRALIALHIWTMGNTLYGSVFVIAIANAQNLIM